MKKLTDVLNKLPHVHKFTIPMVADSTNEVWTDINTNLRNGDGWHLEKFEYGWESIDPTVPLVGSLAGDNAICLQIHRNTDNEVFLNANDNDVLLHHHIAQQMTTSGLYTMVLPYEVPMQAVTTKPKLRFLFRSDIDLGIISLTTVQMYGRIYYHKLNGPKNAGFTKHGQIKEL